MNGDIEGFILFGDLNTVVYWYGNKALEEFLRDKCERRGLDADEVSSNLTQLFGHLINVEAQYDTKQNNVDLIYCVNGFNVKLRHLGIYSLLVMGNSEEDSHLLYMADMFRAISQIFVGYSYGSMGAKPDVATCISEILQRNSVLESEMPYQFLRACEVMPVSYRDSSSSITTCLERLVSTATAASILDGFGTVLEAHCFVSNMLIGSVRCAPQTTRQRILPSELWKLRDMATVVTQPGLAPGPCTTVNVFLNSCESPYFLACRAHLISPAKDVTIVVLTEHDWAPIARPIRRLLKLLSMILRGQPSVLRLTPRHLDTIASTELNRMSDCLDSFAAQDPSKNDAKLYGKSSTSNNSGEESLGSSISSAAFPSGAKMLPSLSGVRSKMQQALSQFRTLRAKNAFQSFCRDPRNTAHHSTVKQLYNIVEQLHTLLFQPLVFINTPDILARPLQVAAQDLAPIVSDVMSLGGSLPPMSGEFADSLMLCVLVDRSSNTFACHPSLRLEPETRLKFNGGACSFSLHNLLNFLQTSMWRCWPIIRSGHSAASWVTDFVDCDEHGAKRMTPVRFAYASNVVNAPVSKKLSFTSGKPAPQLSHLLPVGDASQFEQVFNDPDVTSQLVWNEHFYRTLARIYAESSVALSPNGGSNVFSLDFNANMRSRQSVAEHGSNSKEKTLTIIYEAFCMFLEPISSSEVDKAFKSLFNEGIGVFADSDRFFPLNGISVSLR